MIGPRRNNKAILLNQAAPTFRKIVNISNIFKFGVSKIKNKNVKRTMRSDIANIVVDKARSRAQNKYENLFEN